jgi:hypothetical protein
MFTAFMGDSSNIMSFYGHVDVNDSVGYSVEWSVFKPQKSGQQVKQSNVFYDYNNLTVCNSGHQARKYFL